IYAAYNKRSRTTCSDSHTQDLLTLRVIWLILFDTLSKALRPGIINVAQQRGFEEIQEGQRPIRRVVLPCCAHTARDTRNATRNGWRFSLEESHDDDPEPISVREKGEEADPTLAAI